MIRVRSNRSALCTPHMVPRILLALTVGIFFLNLPARAATFIVTTENDFGVGCLREAISNANETAGADTISFDLPGPGPHVILLNRGLPAITGQLEIVN